MGLGLGFLAAFSLKCATTLKERSPECSVAGSTTTTGKPECECSEGTSSGSSNGNPIPSCIAIAGAELKPSGSRLRAKTRVQFQFSLSQRVGGRWVGLSVSASAIVRCASSQRALSSGGSSSSGNSQHWQHHQKQQQHYRPAATPATVPVRVPLESGSPKKKPSEKRSSRKCRLSEKSNSRSKVYPRTASLAWPPPHHPAPPGQPLRYPCRYQDPYQDQDQDQAAVVNPPLESCPWPLCHCRRICSCWADPPVAWASRRQWRPCRPRQRLQVSSHLGEYNFLLNGRINKSKE